MNATDAPSTSQRTITSLRAFPQSWYLVAPSKSLRKGGVLSLEFLGQPLVLFRTSAGVVHAMDAHCAHMGAHLGKGKVINDCLRCPLHHWTYDGNGRCATGFAGPGNRNGDFGGCQTGPSPQPSPGVPGEGVRGAQRTWPVEERFGNIFLFNGVRPLFEFPSFEFAPENELRTRIGRPVHLRCAWVALAANAFDMQHLSVVHGRELVDAAKVEHPDPHRLRLLYTSRVTGRGLADRITKWLSGDRIHVRITCWAGTILIVESQVGRAKTTMFLALTPSGPIVTASPVFGTRRSRIPGLDRLKLRIISWLFSHFMYKDVSIVEDMRFKVVMADQAPGSPLRSFLDFLDGLAVER